MSSKRILLKLSGEYLAGKSESILDKDILDSLSLSISKIVELGIQVSLVVGGGNILRGKSFANLGFDRVCGDHIGLLATSINGLAMSDSLERFNIKTKLFSSISMDGIIEPVNAKLAIDNLEKGKVNIFVGGTGNPFFTTDTAACLRAIETKSDIVIKATKVNGVYSDDPVSNPNAKHYPKITYDEVLAKELSVMDLTSILLCKEHKMPIRVFDISKSDALIKVAQGEDIGTFVY